MLRNENQTVTTRNPNPIFNPLVTKTTMKSHFDDRRPTMVKMVKSHCDDGREDPEKKRFVMQTQFQIQAGRN